MLSVPPCECCDPCVVASDTFTYDRLSTDYTVDSGSWTVSGGALSTSSTDAVLVSNASPSATEVRVTATITCASTSDAGRVFVGYNTGTTYWYAEVQPGASSGTLKLYEDVSGTPTQRGLTIDIAGYGAGDPIVVSICYIKVDAGTPGNAVATAHAVFGGNDYIESWRLTHIGTGDVGLATGAVGSSVTFDDFSVEHHGDVEGVASQPFYPIPTHYDYDGQPYDDCDICDPRPVCIDFILGTVPDEITVTLSSGFSGLSPDCSCSFYNGKSYTLERDDTSDQCRYILENTSSCDGGSTDSVEVIFTGRNPLWHVYIVVTLTTPNGTVTWEYDASDALQINGSSFSHVASYFGTTTGCTANTTTATVSV